MTDEIYDLVFSGELVRGAEFAQSKRNLGALFKISEAKTEALFSGKSITLKKNLDFATANKYRVAIKKAGCRVDLVEVKEASASGQKTESSNANPQATNTQAASAKNQSVEKKSTERSSSSSSSSIPSPSIAAAAIPRDDSADSAQNNYGFNGPSQSGLLTKESSQTPAPPLPIVEELEGAPPPDEMAEQADSFSLSSSLGYLVESHELERVEAIDVDTTGFSLKVANGYLLDEVEKADYETPALGSTLNADLAPVGSDLLSASERDKVEVIEIDLSHFSVAEPGEDLGQEKDTKEALNPDISYLSIE